MSLDAVRTPPDGLHAARLPRWALPSQWPMHDAQPALADVRLADGRIESIRPSAAVPDPAHWRLNGAPVLPGMVQAHTHIDKAYTRFRLGRPQPGLLGAIQSMVQDRERWSEADVHARASRCLHGAFDAGVVHLRTHCDWWEPHGTPLAWGVLRDLAQEWRGRIVVERVALINLVLFNDRDGARAMARAVAAGGAGACLGGFVHSTNWSAQSLRHLFEAAMEFGLDVDLHCDEELNPRAVGLAATAALVREIGCTGRVICGHACALAAQSESQALATLDAVATVPITMVTLPTTNLLLQDAVAGRTPRWRGITLVKEARERGIPVLVASDNVQDAFCPIGSFDPLDALTAAVLAAQLDDPFDVWSEAVCRADWLARGAAQPPLRAGDPADLVVFGATDASGWPSAAQTRVVLRAGRLASGVVPARWQAERPSQAQVTR